MSPRSGGPTVAVPAPFGTNASPRVQVPSVPQAASDVSHGSRETLM
jgi:hypothetical protein